MTGFRILYNQDCTNLFAITREPITPAHVDRMVEEVALGGSDVFLVNPNAQRVNYPSRVWQTFWDGYRPDDDSLLGSIPQETLPGRRHLVEQMQRLAESGCDYLARALGACRQTGLLPGIALRMNDMHDQPWPDSHFHSSFYREHPDWHLDNSEIAGWGRTGLNYEIPEVRAHYLTLIRELVEGYDFEVLELDFMRFGSYFPRADFTRHAATMTHWLGEVRQLLDSAPRHIELIPRVATSPAAAFELGFDVATWAREGLVDGLTSAAFLNTNWDLCVEEFSEVLDSQVPVYAGTDYGVHRVNELPPCCLPAQPEFLRGLASGYAIAGAAGLNLFNFFCSREEDPPQEPAFSILGELREPARLRGKPKAYTVTGATDGGMLETDRPAQVPIVLPSRRAQEFRLLMRSEPEGVEVNAEVCFTGETLPEPTELWLRLNASAAGPASDFEDLPGTNAEPIALARYTLPASALRDGWNRLHLRNEGPEIAILGVVVRVA